MLYIIAKNSGLHRELKKIKKIRAKYSNKIWNSSSDYSSYDSDSSSSPARDSSWDTYRRPAGRKEMKKLDHVVNNNLKTTKDQFNEAIEYEPIFDYNSFNLSSDARKPLPVVTVSLIGVKKHRATNVADLTFLWDSGATYSMINRKHTKHYERKIWSNKVEYITPSGVYCTTHDVKVPFFMPDFSSSNIINHRFNVNNYKGESGIGYYIIIGRYLMVQLGLTADF